MAPLEERDCECASSVATSPPDSPRRFFPFFLRPQSLLAAQRRRRPRSEVEGGDVVCPVGRGGGQGEDKRRKWKKRRTRKHRQGFGAGGGVRGGHWTAVQMSRDAAAEEQEDHPEGEQQQHEDGQAEAATTEGLDGEQTNNNNSTSNTFSSRTILPGEGQRPQQQHQQQQQQQQRAKTGQKQYVMALDVGTTKVKALIFDEAGKIVAHSSQRVKLIYPQPGWIEIGPDQLWSAVVTAMKDALKRGDLTARDLSCLGVSTQRATFVTWDRDTGKEFHNFITWKDVRADSLVREWNKSLTMKGLRCGSSFLYFVTRQKRFRVASILSLQNKMVNMRLLWALQNVPELKAAARRGCAMFGTLDTWLLYKFSKGHTYLTEIACASATGLFDPFLLEYGDWAFKMFGIPRDIMPPVVDSAGEHFGSVHPDVLGHAVPIRAVMADQSAAVFGSGCLHRGDTKMTLGTGSFLDVNTGRDPHASINGLVPVVGWRYGDALCFLAEGSNHDTSSLIEWARQLELFNDPNETSDIAASVDDRNFDLYFVPSFFGLQAPINDPDAGAGFIGIRPQTGKKEMLRAVLESIAFTMKQLQETMEQESSYHLHNIQIDGGVSRNDFVVQMISSVTGKTIHRARNPEVASFGAAFMAGLDAGIWKSVEEMERLRVTDKVFEPSTDTEYVKDVVKHYKKWVDACYRFTDWYNTADKDD